MKTETFYWWLYLCYDVLCCLVSFIFQNSMLETLQTILDKTIEWGRKPWWMDLKNLKCNSKNVRFTVKIDIACLEWIPCLEKSYNDLFSIESWLLQSMKRKTREDKDELEALCYTDWEVMYDYTDRQYQAMMMSVLNQERKIEYFINNVE